MRRHQRKPMRLTRRNAGDFEAEKRSGKKIIVTSLPFMPYVKKVKELLAGAQWDRSHVIFSGF